MSPPLPLVGSGEPVDCGRRALEQADAVMVLDDGKPVGVLTRQDLLAYLAPSSTRVGPPPDSVAKGVTREAAVTELDAGPTVADWLRRNVAAAPDALAVRRMRPQGSEVEDWTWGRVADESARLARAFGRLRDWPGATAPCSSCATGPSSTSPTSARCWPAAPRCRSTTPPPRSRSATWPRTAGPGSRWSTTSASWSGCSRSATSCDLRAVVVVDPGRAGPGGRAPLRRPARRRPGRPRHGGRGGPYGRPGHRDLHLRTGPPKGVLLDHANVSWQSVGYTRLIGPQPDARAVSYLPMAHIAERVVTHYAWLGLRAQVTCCPDQTALGQYLAAVRPTSLFGPPRVFEKMRAGIEAAVAGGRGSPVRPGAAGGRPGRRAAGRRPAAAGLLAAAWEQVDAAAFAPLRARIGLDRRRYAFAGAAPLPVDVLHFFRSIRASFSGVPVGRQRRYDLGPVPGASRHLGPPLPGDEVRIADDGELLCRGEMVSRGYQNDPERTAETIDADGWLSTGDIGRIDADGYLSIIDRKKELIITAGGKNISPANLESAAEVAFADRPGLRDRRQPRLPDRVDRPRRAGRAGVGRAARGGARPPRRARRPPRGPGRDGARRGRGQPALLAGREHQAIGDPGRRVGPGLAAADRDDEAQAAVLRGVSRT